MAILCMAMVVDREGYAAVVHHIEENDDDVASVAVDYCKYSWEHCNGIVALPAD